MFGLLAIFHDLRMD